MRYGQIEILVDGVGVDRTQETIGQAFVSYWFKDWDAQAAVNYHFHYHHGPGGAPPEARLVWTEIPAPSPGGPQ